MTRTSIQVLIVYTSLSLISAMPFLDTDNDLDKLHGEDDFDIPTQSDSLSDMESKLENLDMDMLTTEALLDILARYKEMKEMQQEDEERTKRFEVRRIPHARQFRSDGARRFIAPRVFVASRGKRQKYDGAYYDNIENIIRVSNRLDPDEAPSYSAPHLDPNCLQRLSGGQASPRIHSPARPLIGESVKNFFH